MPLIRIPVLLGNFNLPARSIGRLAMTIFVVPRVSLQVLATLAILRTPPLQKVALIAAWNPASKGPDPPNLDSPNDLSAVTHAILPTRHPYHNFTLRNRNFPYITPREHPRHPHKKSAQTSTPTIKNSIEQHRSKKTNWPSAAHKVLAYLAHPPPTPEGASNPTKKTGPTPY